MGGESGECLRFLEGGVLPGDWLPPLPLLESLYRDRFPSSSTSIGLLLRVGDLLSLPRRSGERLRLMSSRTGRCLGLRIGDREYGEDRARADRRPPRSGDFEQLGEIEYLRLFGGGEADLLTSEALALSGEDVFLLRFSLRRW